MGRSAGSRRSLDRIALVPELRHDRLAELLLHGVRRQRVDLQPAPGPIPTGFDRHRGDVRAVLTLAERAVRRHGVLAVAATTRRSSRTASRRAASSPVPRNRRPLSKQAIWGGIAGAQFDPCYHAGLRHVRQHQRRRARRQHRRRRVRGPQVLVLDRVGQRCSGRARCPASSRCRRRAGPEGTFTDRRRNPLILSADSARSSGCGHRRVRVSVRLP